MKFVTSQEDFDKAKSKDLIIVECSYCHGHFKREKHFLQADIKHQSKVFCNRICSKASRFTGETKPCSHCNKPVYRTKSGSKHKGLKSNRCFCNQSCAAKYNNIHKTHGTRRAKLEVWLESQLKLIYPNLEIKYSYILPNCCELDIYIPSLALAFELNGIYHYEPIYGQEKLNRTQNNDSRKFKHCHDNNIGLCVIDTSKQIRFTPPSSQVYLDIILNLIKQNYSI